LMEGFLLHLHNKGRSSFFCEFHGF
jgi:hypothetical protein